MNTPNTHTQLPENCIVIDREWLEAKIKGYERVIEGNLPSPFISQIKTIRNELSSVLNNSYPLTPILEEYWKDGWELKDANTDNGKYFLKDYLQQPITLKKK